jgi:hypothetical protein
MVEGIWGNFKRQIEKFQIPTALLLCCSIGMRYALFFTTRRLSDLRLNSSRLHASRFHGFFHASRLYSRFTQKNLPYRNCFNNPPLLKAEFKEGFFKMGIWYAVWAGMV